MGKGASAPEPEKASTVNKAEWGTDVAAAGFGMKEGTPAQFSPGGSVTFEKHDLPEVNLGPDKFGNPQIVPGGQGISEVHKSFSPELQSVFDSLVGKGTGLANALPAGGFDPNINTEDLRKAYVKEGTENVKPVWEREDNQFNTLMAERGIPIGSEIWDDQRSQIADARNQYMEGLTDQAHQAAAADQSRQFQLALAERQVPWNEFANLYQGVQGLLAGLEGRDTPLVPVQAPNVDVSGNYNREYQQRYNNWAATNSNANAGVGMGIQALSMIPSFWAMSDERTKEAPDGGPPVEIGQTNDGQGIYAYNYKHDPPGTPLRMGLLAQNVEQKHPEAVAEIGGIKHVDYSKALKKSARS